MNKLTNAAMHALTILGQMYLNDKAYGTTTLSWDGKRTYIELYESLVGPDRSLIDWTLPYYELKKEMIP